MAKGLTDAQLDAMDEMDARQNLYGTAARVLESPDAVPMTDAQMDQRATSDSVMQATPFGQKTIPQSAPQPPQADFREPAKPMTDAELNAQEDNLYYDPSYEMPFEEFAPVHARRQQEKNTVGSFVDGAMAAGQGLVSLTAGVGQELKDNATSNFYRPDRFATQNFVTFKEAGRKAGLEFAKFVDWVGNTARDHATDVRRQEQVRGAIAQRLQAEGKLSGDLRADLEIINREFSAAKERGETAPTPLEENADVKQAFEDYRRGKNFDREIAGVGNYNIGQTPVTQESSEARATNPITGEVMEPQRALATGVSMALAFDNLLPVGAGALSKARILRRLSSITGVPLKMAEEAANAGADAIKRGSMRITDRVQDLTGMNAGQQTAAAAALTGGVGYLSAQGQGAPAALGGVATGVLSILPIMKFGGAILRKTGAVAGGGYAIVREMGAGGAGVAGAEAADAMAKSGVFPQRYARHMQPGGASADSTLRRVAQDPENPQMLRRLSRTANNLGATQAFRLADDAVSSAVVSGLTVAPFALVAPDAEQGGQIVGGAVMLGTLAGTATRSFGRRPAEVDADIARMLVDVTESNGDAASLMSLSHDSLSQLAAMQGVLRNKVKFIPLRGQDYRANADLRAAGGETAAGLYIEKDANGSARIFVNMGHTAPMDGKVSVRPDADKGGNVIDITAADGTVDSTHVPQGIRLMVKTGDAVSANQRLAQDLSPTRIVPHEIGHAILTSDILGGQPRNDLRNLVNQQYATDGVAARGREYATRLVDKDILVGAIEDAPVNLTDAQINDVSSGKTTLADVLKGQPVSEQARQRLIDQRVEELSQRSIEKGQDPLDWARDEIIAETFASEAPAIDFRAIRRDAMFPRLAESMLSAGGRVLEVMGARLDPGTGKLMDNPSVLFRDNPLFQDRIMQKRVREYVRSYDQYLAGLEEAGAKELRGVELARSSRPEDLARSTHVKLRDEGNGVLENDFMVQRPDGTYTMKAQTTVNLTENARSAQIKTLYDARKFVPVNSQEFGKRKVNGREVVGGPVLPPQFDFFTNFPKHVREFARDMEQGRAEGGSWDIDVNVIGTGSSGRYRVTNLGNTRAIQRETVPFGWQVTKANHLLAASLDLNAFRGSAMKAINKGDLGLFNNDMRQVEADLKTYLANHRNGRPGEMTIGQQKRDMLNGLIGTGTAVQRTANPLYSDLNPRGSIRTWRVDRLNDAKPTGRTGYFFDYDKINNNRMPSALPQAGMAMPEVPVGPREATITQDGLVQAPEDAPTFKLPRRAMAQFMPDTGIRLEDYADRPIVALPADRMGIGQMRVGPKGSEQILSVPGQGGAGFMEIYNGGGWAFTDTPTADRFLGRLREVARPGDTSVIVGITALNEVNHLKNQTGQLAYVEALEAAIKNKSVSRKQADAHIREIAKRIYTSEASPKALTQSTRDKFKAMRSFDDFQKAVRAKSLNFADAAWLLKKMQQKALPLPYKDAQAIGIAFDDVARQTADPRYADVPFGTVVALLEVPINQAPSRNPFHYAYPAKVEGNRIGFLSKFQNIDDLTSDPRIRNKQGRVTAQPLQTVLPVMDRIGQSPRGQAMPDVADAPPFYLKSSQALDAKVQGKTATVEQIKAILTNPQNGIKAEELKWTGVMQEVERLAKENNGKVPKEALLRYLAEDGAVRLEEVTLRESGTKRNLANEEQLGRLGYSSEVSEDGLVMAFMDLNDPGDMMSAAEMRQFGLPAEAVRLADTIERSFYGSKGSARYGSYQLPGGENYREVVLAMPEREITQIPKGWRIQKLSGDRPNGYGYTLINEADNTGTVIYGTNEATATQSAIKAISGKSKPPYTSTHFDTPNYVAHMRLNERVDAKGKPGLFIEELQSDRHQQGREKGYKGDANPERDALQAKYDEATAKRNAARDALSNAIMKGAETGKFLSDAAERKLTQNLQNAQMNMGTALGELRRVKPGQVPDAPFRTSWPLQLFKRALRDAVADGKDWIGWTTGETQAARYDLSKQVDSISVSRGGGEQWEIWAEKDGRQLFNNHDVSSIDQIATIIGKDLAAKVSDMKPGETARTFSGVDLKVGGEGMKGFYDTMVPKDVAKYVKQWGAQVEKGKLPEVGIKKSTRNSDGSYSVEFSDGEIGTYDSLSDATADSPATPLWRVNITPQMRKGIKKAGQALFVGGAAAVVAEDQLEQ